MPVMQRNYPHMKTVFRIMLVLALFLVAITSAPAAGQYHEISYPPSTQAGELQLGVTYTLWIPDGVTRLRGIIVHQHGCGSGACKGGETAAYDLHWQALAKKWDCALLGPSYHQDDKQNCRLWCDPRNGSARTFLKALGELAGKSKHPELDSVPWCLWGHSGGGFWASLMQTAYPDRIVAIWFRSGTAYATWEKGDIARPEIPPAAYAIPMMCNPGAKEKGDKRFDGAWTGSLAMFKAYRAKGAPVGFAPDPRTSHECGDSRYLAIPFFDACLALRLPDKDSKDQKLKPVDLKAGWLAPLLGEKAEAAAKYTGKVDEAVWLPSEAVAKAWEEYVKSGAVSDTTPPPAPFGVKVAVQPDKSVEITWDAEADVESGLQAFVIQRDGKDLMQIPEKPVGRYGRPLFQVMSYHDTPERPLPAMRYVDRDAKGGDQHEYRVIAVNGVGLKSAPSPLAAHEVDAVAGKRVVVLGDSITQSGGYVTFITYYLEKRHPKKDFDILGLGLASETLSGLSEDGHAGGKFPRPCLFERLGRLLDKTKPDIVFACYGMNDGIYQPLDDARFTAFKKGVTKLIEQCNDAGVKDVFLITPPIFDFKPKGDEFNYDSVLTAYAKWETELKVPGVRVIDLHTAMRKARDAQNEPISQDRVHPGDAGHLLMAQTVLTGLGMKVPDETVADIKKDPLYKLVAEKRALRSGQWMKHIGYTREAVVAPQPLGPVEADAARVQEKIDALRRGN